VKIVTYIRSGPVVARNDWNAELFVDGKFRFSGGLRLQRTYWTAALWD